MREPAVSDKSWLHAHDCEALLEAHDRIAPRRQVNGHAGNIAYPRDIFNDFASSLTFGRGPSVRQIRRIMNTLNGSSTYPSNGPQRTKPLLSYRRNAGMNGAVDPVSSHRLSMRGRGTRRQRASTSVRRAADSALQRAAPDGLVAAPESLVAK
jgi:hypothetical protein